jgi:hypothetical protein
MITFHHSQFSILNSFFDLRATNHWIFESCLRNQNENPCYAFGLQEINTEKYQFIFGGSEKVHTFVPFKRKCNLSHYP